MTPNRFIVSFFTTILAVTHTAAAKEFVVSPQGNDKHDGSANSPFASLQKAASVMKAGDTCLIRGGTYTTPLKLNQLKGHDKTPITFKAWPGETVVLNGTLPLKGHWQPWKNNILRTKVNHPVKQLFQGEQFLIPARWPNADVYDESAFDLHGTWRHVDPQSTFGTIQDATPTRGGRHHAPWLKQSRIDQNTQTLADTGKNFTGAVAVMNIGSWLSWAQTITKHQAGSNTFSFDQDFSRSGKIMARCAKHFPANPTFWKKKIQRSHEGYYYIQGSLACLDAPGEWYYDSNEKWLYLIPRKGEHTFRSRQHDRIIDATNCQYLTFENIRFKATLATFSNCTHIRLEGCRFEFPSTTAFGLGDFRRPEVVHFTSSKKFLTGLGKAGTHNQVINCQFLYTNGPALEISGTHDRVENCYFYAIDWTCLGNGGEGSLNFGNSSEMIFRRNTLDLAGNSEGVRTGRRSLVEYNHISRTSLLQHDGSAINAGVNQIEGTVMRRNWVHDTPKAALRFDSANMGSPDVRYGYRGAMIENVCWNTLQLKIKGEEHTIRANTAFGSPRVDIAVLDNLLAGGINKKTVTTNNLATVLSGSFGNPKAPVPGIHSHNWTGDVGSQLRAPTHLDFRPRPDSLIANAGQPNKKNTPCAIGAYQLHAKDYWIPGHLSASASMPIPQHHAKEVSHQTELMWRPALQGDHYKVYWGHNDGKLTLVQTSPLCFFTPPVVTAKDSGKTFQWRVDTVTHDKKVITGTVWKYQVQ